MLFTPGIAYLDPGNLESQLQAGAQAGYTLMWVLMWVIIMVRFPNVVPPPLPLCTCKASACCCCCPCKPRMRDAAMMALTVAGCWQGYLMQMLSVKLGVATGLNLAQHCRYVRAQHAAHLRSLC